MAPEDFRPTASRDALAARAKLLGLLRDFFAERGVLEVETPVLSAAGNSDPGIAQLRTQDGGWLRTSPEYPLKRLLAAGCGDVFELGRVFRRGEAGGWHNPEFTLLEWYRVGWDYPALMEEVAALVLRCGEAFGRSYAVERVTWREWIERHAGIDPLVADEAMITARLRRAGVDTAGLHKLDRDGWLDLLVSHLVQPALPRNVLTLVSLYPASQAALAQVHAPDPRLAERFEAFLGPVELANGYQELSDAEEQRRRFDAENRKRERLGQPVVPLDRRLLAALEAGLPPCSGVALGVDRLLAVLVGAARLDGVIAFPADRA